MYVATKHMIESHAKNTNVPGPSSSSNKKTRTSNSVPRKIVRHYNEDYLNFGFTCSDEAIPRPVCVICEEKLANESMVPSKLKRHFNTKHSHLSEMKSDYFRTILQNKTYLQFNDYVQLNLNWHYPALEDK